MRKWNPLPSYTLGEELCNSISHGIGAVLSVAGCVLAIIQSVLYGDGPRYVVSASVFGASLIVMYCMSTLYHALTAERAKRIFRIFDHTSIFFLIAGTYTPLTLITLRGPLGWTMFGLVWGAAIIGIVLNSISIERFKIFSMITYLCMGWAVVIGIVPIFQSMHPRGLILLVAGGVSYTAGILFYALKRYKYMHSVWHFFVLAGSILHFFCIYLYVLPVK